eukprot:scaffold7990_cov72-Phaeocystis_antarctica.AAC.1
MALRAGCRRHSCLCAAREARWAKPCTRRARLLVSERSIAAEHAGRAGKGGCVLLPVAGLVEGGGLAGTGGLFAVVNVVGGSRLAACGSRLASGVALVTRLSPDFALGRGHPVAWWRGKHVGCGAAGAKVEVRAFFVYSPVGHERGKCH